MIEKLDILTVLSREGIDVDLHGRFICPFHDDRSPSGKAWPSSGRWFCFACGFGGDAVEFVRRRHNVGFKDALRILGIEMCRPDPDVTRRLKLSREISRRFEKWRRWHIGRLVDAIREKENALLRSLEEKLWERDEESFWEIVYRSADVPRLEWKVRLLRENEVPVVKEIAREYFNAVNKSIR